MTKRIPLSQGLFALVDDCDFEWLTQWKWCAAKSKDGRIYAQRTQTFPIRKCILMHRVITNAPKGMLVDHKDHDGLNNQRYNLRVCTNLQNQCNAGKRVTNSTGYKGVCVHKGSGKFQAAIRVNGKTRYLGSFDNPLDAAIVYDEAARMYHGEFAMTNFEGV